MWSPHATKLGGYGPNDGTIDFYSRVATLAAPDRVLLDLGAGRGEWYEDDTIEFRKSQRLMKGRFATVVAVDVDVAVLQNRTADRTELIRDGLLPLAKDEVDVIVCDYVMEHVEDVSKFFSEVNRVLKPGGWFCARTPHKYNYVSLASRIIGEKNEQRVLKHAQPMRKDVDVFKKHYLINTRSALRSAFQGWDDKSFVFRSEPAYFFGLRSAFRVQDFIHRTLPAVVSGNIFVFLRKPGTM